jgi:hypothetical protein
MSESDRSVLRRLADDGNEDATDRLAELAAERGDLKELRRLVDSGNENAADRPTELAAERGDLEELRRLVDEGNENAAERLTELAAERSDPRGAAASVRRGLRERCGSVVRVDSQHQVVPYLVARLLPMTPAQHDLTI